MIQLVIPGAPYGKGRPRMIRSGVVYTPKKTINHETLIKELFAINYSNHIPWNGPVVITIRAYFPIPKSTSKKLCERMQTEKVGYPHRADWDNIGKICSDALNHLAYKDDAQVIEGTVYKYYSSRPRVEIELQSLDGDEYV